MKTINDFYQELMGSEALQYELKAIKDEDALASFLIQHGCNASAKEFIDFIQSQSDGELTDDDANGVAGGFAPWWGKSDIYKSINLPQQKGI